MLERDAFIDDYVEELRENIQSIDNSIVLLKLDPDNEEELNRLLRYLHTVKGSSKMLKFSKIEKLSHALEDIFKGIKEKRYGLGEKLLQLVFVSTEYLRLGARRIQTSKSDEIPLEDLLDTVGKAIENGPFSLEHLQSQIGRLREREGPATPEKSDGQVQQQTAEIRTEKPEFHKKESEFQSIRIQTHQIDEIIKALNNLIIRHFQLKKEYEQLSHIERKLKDTFDDIRELSINPVEKVAEIWKDVEELRKRFLEKILLLEKHTMDVQNKTVSLRMFPLEKILAPLPKMTVELAMKLGKDIELAMTGTDIHVDKAVLEKISDPIIHLVRNAVDHGIEPPAERERTGKRRTGKITISCRREWNNIFIDIVDDGRGIDFERVRASAISMRPAMKSEIASMNENKLLSFLFMPGFSTKTEVTELSGRGVGLDLVKSGVERAKGKISIHSEQGQGSTITLGLPSSLATIRGYFVEVQDAKFFFPSYFIKEIVMLEKSRIFDVLSKESFRLRRQILPLYYMDHLLQMEHTAPNDLFVLVVESLGEIIGIAVDSIIEYASLIYNSLPGNLQKLTAVQGVVFDENYNMVTILHVPDLIERFKASGPRIQKQSRGQALQQHILFVDDSHNAREIAAHILASAGFQVVTAVNGLEGMEKLKERDFDLVITDLEMPEMDGFTLIEVIKREAKYAKIPILVLSNSLANQERAVVLGVDYFIEKSKFDRDHLIHAVRELIQRGT